MKKNEKLLIIGAAGVALYFFLNKQDAVVDPGVTMPEQYENDTSVPSPEIHTNDPATAQARTALAKTYLAQLKTYDPSRYVTYVKMTDQELIDAWEYVWSFMLKGKKLYRLPGATGLYVDGDYNTKLFDAIALIKTKYGIF